MLNIQKLLKSVVNINRGLASKQKCQELVTLDEMPVPKGDFFKLHRKRNRRYNSILALGVVMVATAVTIFRESKLVGLNFSPPETYEN